MYPDKTIIQKDTCAPVFIEVLLTRAKTWKQSKSPLTDEWIKLWYIPYNGILLSHKKNETMPHAAIWIELEIIMLSEVSQSQIPCDITHMGGLKYDTNELMKQKQTHRHREQTYGCQGGREVGDG